MANFCTPLSHLYTNRLIWNMHCWQKEGGEAQHLFCNDIYLDFWVYFIMFVTYSSPDSYYPCLHLRNYVGSFYWYKNVPFKSNKERLKNFLCLKVELTVFSDFQGNFDISF